MVASCPIALPTSGHISSAENIASEFIIYNVWARVRAYVMYMCTHILERTRFTGRKTFAAEFLT